jgi:hypothetical protein
VFTSDQRQNQRDGIRLATIDDTIHLRKVNGRAFIIIDNRFPCRFKLPTVVAVRGEVFDEPDALALAQILGSVTNGSPVTRRNCRGKIVR